jgi:hypothetical protein
VVRDGPIDVDLPMPDPAATPHLVVKLAGPGGAALTGRVSFRLAIRTPSRPRYHWPTALRRTDGRWMLLLTGIERKGVGEATLRVATPEYGSVEHRIALASTGSVTVQFGPPARVRLRVEGLAGRLSAALASERTYTSSCTVTPDGTSDLMGVQPGEYGLQLVLQTENGRFPIAQRQVVLEAGENEQTMAVPELHALRVRRTGRLRGHAVTLYCTDPGVGSFHRAAARTARDTVVFEDLGPGSYEIECGKRRFAVRVPGPAEVTIE